MDVQQPQYINVNGRLLDLATPRVMGILNLTPDSFYADSRQQSDEAIASRVRQIQAEGGEIIDVGAYSSRPGADHVSAEEELARLRHGLEIVRRTSPDAVVSVDTFRAEVARCCVEEYGVAIVNDISGGTLDADMFRTVAELRVPYVLTHIQGTPQDMQASPYYANVWREVLLYFAERVQQLRDLGARDIILDPGFGFGKTLDHNYRLLARLEELRLFGLPVLAGLSRKSMICRVLGIEPRQALNGTTVLNTVCLLKGVNLLRVHDVAQAVEAVKLVNQLKKEEEACSLSLA